MWYLRWIPAALGARHQPAADGRAERPRRGQPHVEHADAARRAGGGAGHRDGRPDPRLQRCPRRRDRAQRVVGVPRLPAPPGRVRGPARRRPGVRPVPVHGVPRRAAPRPRRRLGAATVPRARGGAPRGPAIPSGRPRSRPSASSPGCRCSRRGIGASAVAAPSSACSPSRLGPACRPGGSRAGAVPALACFVLVAGLPLAVQFLGPLRITAPVQEPSAYSTDLLNLVLPTPYQLVAPAAATDSVARNSAACTTRRRRTSACRCSLVLAGAVVVRWSDRRIRVAGLVALVMLVLSLGPVLHVGTVATGIPLPWLPFSRLPLLEHAVPGRLTLYAWLARGRRSSRSSWTARCPRGARSRGWPSSARRSSSSCPRRSRPARSRSRRRSASGTAVGIDRDAVVLFAPHFTNGAGAAPMLWAAVADDPPRMREAYAFVPAADRDAPLRARRPPSSPGSWTRSRTAARRSSPVAPCGRRRWRTSRRAGSPTSSSGRWITARRWSRSSPISSGGPASETLGVDVWRDVGPGG